MSGGSLLAALGLGATITHAGSGAALASVLPVLEVEPVAVLLIPSG